MIGSQTVSYLLEVSLYHVLFFAFYWFVMKRDTFFTLNRVYLLAGLVCAFLLPLLSFVDGLNPSEHFTRPVDAVYNMVATPVSHLKEPTSNIAESWSVWTLYSMLESVYLLGIIILSIRFFHNIFKLLNLSNNYVKTSGKKIIYQTSLSDAFSFFTKIYLPHAWANSKGSEMIIAHEEAHVRYWHSVDRLLMDVVAILFWFNPFIHFYRKALIENHEYEADFAVINQCDRFQYQQLLLTKSSSYHPVPLASSFSSLTKKRIIMMNKNKSTVLSRFKFILMLPVLLMAVVISSYKPKSLSASMNGFIGPDFSKSIRLEVPIGSDIPSIFPVQHKTAYPLSTPIAKVRVSSTFGERKDPFTKTMKFHKGIDIATHVGAPVIAAANGIVTEVDYKPEGYGKYIWLTHSDGYATRYAQLNDYVVKVGDKVKLGQIIGYVGSTGKSTAPHLHYEVTKDGKAVDPVKYIKDYTFDDC